MRRSFRILDRLLPGHGRYAAFKAYRKGQVWVYERRQTPAGANADWSRSVTIPIADLVKIFHPRRTPDHVFEWYMPVPQRQRDDEARSGDPGGADGWW